MEQYRLYSVQCTPTLYNKFTHIIHTHAHWASHSVSSQCVAHTHTHTYIYIYIYIYINVVLYNCVNR